MIEKEIQVDAGQVNQKANTKPEVDFGQVVKEIVRETEDRKSVAVNTWNLIYFIRK
jgi:hypothetical protein